MELARFFNVTILSDSIPAEGMAGVTFVCISPFRFDFLRRYCHVPNHLGFVAAARRHLARVHARQPIHGILCHSHTSAALAARPFGACRGVSYGLVTHGDIFDVPAGSYDSRLTRFYKAVHPTAYRNAALVVALSPHMAQCAVSNGANPMAIRVLPNGIDVADFGLDSEWDTVLPAYGLVDDLRILYAGRLAREKGADVLVRAMRQLVDRGVKVNLRIIGDGPEATATRALCELLGLTGVVKFSGSVHRSEMGAAYGAADVVCVPSIADPLPTVVLEAMAAGRAIVASRTGGIPFMIDDESSGILVEPGNPTELARVLERLAGNREVLEGMGRQAATVARKRFSWRAIGEELAEAVEQKLGLTRSLEIPALAMSA